MAIWDSINHHLICADLYDRLRKQVPVVTVDHNDVIVNELQLQIEIDKLKTEFAETKDIYREVCVLLFFRYGITPTANKLYQYVRRGSMSAPAEALNKFWLELREKSRVRIERPDIPENIAAAAGDLIATLWNEAQKAAQAGFSELIDNATAEILHFKLLSEMAEQNKVKTEHLLIDLQAKLESALKQLSETENLRMADMLALANKENAFKALETDRDNLNNIVNDLKASFSRDLSVINLTLNKAEERYRELEKKSLIEIDQSRLQIRKLEKEISDLRVKSKTDQTLFLRDYMKLQKSIAELNQQIGSSSGIISELKKQLRLHEKKLAATEKKHQLYKSKYQIITRKSVE